MVTNTKDPMTAPAMMPVMPFLLDIAAVVVGCGSLWLVGWGVELVPLLRGCGSLWLVGWGVA
jgi:hypothetical protein